MAEAADDFDTRPVVKRGGDPAFNAKVDAMNDEDELQSLLDSTSDPEKRKVIRGRLRIVRVKKRELREARLNAGEEAMVQSKLAMADASKQSLVDAYSKRSDASESSSYSYSSSSYKKSESSMEVSYEEA